MRQGGPTMWRLSKGRSHLQEHQQGQHRQVWYVGIPPDTPWVSLLFSCKSQLKFDTAGTICDKFSQLHDTDSVNTVSTTSVNGTARDAANHPTNPNGSSSSARHTSTLRSPHLPSSASGSCGDMTAVELLTPAASSVAGHETDAGSSPITSVLPPGPLNPTEATRSSTGHLSELVKSDL